MGFNWTFQAQCQFEYDRPQLLAGVIIVLTRVLGCSLIKFFHKSVHLIFRAGRGHDRSVSNSPRRDLSERYRFKSMVPSPRALCPP